MQLRDYQIDILEQIKAAATNDIVQLDTGAGKTPIEAALAGWAPHCMVVAHRVTLIQQISEKLAALGLVHDTVSTEYTRRRCMGAHRKHGHNFIERGHATRLAVSIDSLHAQLARGAMAHIDLLAPWLVIIDEAHHVIPDNKWGRLRELLPNARIVGFTATPGRMDGESLHISKGGLFDRLVQAEGLANDSARVLIERGFLSEFVVYAPQKKQTFPYYVDANELENAVLEDSVAAKQAADTGRERAQSLDYLSGRLCLMGDPVKEYRRRADGTQAIVMCPAIKNAEKFALAFRDAGIAAGAIHSTMPQSQITRTLDAFASGRLRVICNVDMIGEGFDMPSVQTLIIATMTASFPRYRQWCGRVLRPSPGKQRAVIIDLTRQVETHGMPDEPVEWDLLNPPKCPQNCWNIPCDGCGAYYKMRLRECPHCGAANRWLRDGKPLGNFEFDISVLDNGLVQAERIALRAERIAERRQAEVIWPPFNDPGGVLGSVVGSLRKWFVDGLESANVAPARINDFLESHDAQRVGFWQQHFTALDIKNSKNSKIKKVFTQWQQSQNSN